MSVPVYDPGEVALIDALRRDFGERVFAATLRAHPDSQPYRGEDGVWRLRLGDPEIELWVGDDGTTSFGLAHAGVLHTGTVTDGQLVFDDPASLAPPELN